MDLRRIRVGVIRDKILESSWEEGERKEASE